MARLDPHSWADTDHPETASFSWRATVNFETRTLDAEVTLRFKKPGEGPLHLDTRDLTILGARTLAGRAVPWTLAVADAVLGARLELTLPEATEAVVIAYRTSAEASALQWLSPEQTSGKRHGFLFSQCQAIHARSVVPLQDTPRLRVNFDATIDVPSALRVLMGAAFVSRTEEGGRAVERWTMPQPIPPYLLAFAVGDLVSRELGPRSRVWAEPAVLDAAAWEFAEVDAMIAGAEGLFGPYDWDRFDILTMPPSFPYGGMENPRLTFLTPTLLAGDRSLVRVVAHELAHSWTGNLITNANAEHFWLNEGWTRYAELRIVEALEGTDAAALHAALGRRGLDRAIAHFTEQKRPELTWLETNLMGIDPDDAFSEVPYDKGCLFLKAIEAHVGRARFDVFVRAYIAEFRFGAITTSQFTAFVERELPGALAAIDAERWLHGPGVPANAPEARSELLAEVEALGATVPSIEQATHWSATEWQIYLESLPRTVPVSSIATLDARFGLTARTNYDVLSAWLLVALAAGYAPAVARACEVLSSVGRMKYLKPLYAALAAQPSTREVARQTFAKNADRYHPIARRVVQATLARFE